jgi:hypothetical protein
VEESLRKLLDRAVKAEVAAHAVVRPPWVVHPGTDPFEICWRMGGGEWHLMVWWDWWNSGERTEKARIDYFRAQLPPAPWQAWAATAVWPEMEAQNAEEEERWLEAQGAAAARLAEAGVGSYPDWREWIDGWNAEDR